MRELRNEKCNDDVCAGWVIVKVRKARLKLNNGLRIGIDNDVHCSYRAFFIQNLKRVHIYIKIFCQVNTA